MLKVFKLERNNPHWDEYVSVTVVAESEDEARWYGRKLDRMFDNPEYSTCEEIDITVKGVIATDWLSG